MNSLTIDSADSAKPPLMDQVVAAIRRHVEWETDVDYDLHAAWIIGTYFHRIFNSYPYMHVKAPKGSGKSQCLSLMANLCFNATKGRPTLPALGDIVDALRATYLIDQAHLLASPRCEELLDNLTESYRRTGGTRNVMMMERGREVFNSPPTHPKHSHPPEICPKTCATDVSSFL